MIFFRGVSFPFAKDNLVNLMVKITISPEKAPIQSQHDLHMQNYKDQNVVHVNVRPRLVILIKDYLKSK